MLDSQFPGLISLSLSLRNYSLGTIWWVREDIWKSALPPSYSSDRDSHPGLCIRNSPLPPSSPLDVLPLLHGTSNKRSPSQAFPVQGISRNEPAHTTYFQWNLRGRIPFVEFQQERCRPADKPDLTSAELSAFRRELQKRELI